MDITVTLGKSKADNYMDSKHHITWHSELSEKTDVFIKQFSI